MLVDLIGGTGVPVEEHLPVASKPGWPRPYASADVPAYYERPNGPREERSLPVPWVAAKDSDGVKWAAFWKGFGYYAVEFRLCQVCGKELDWVKVFGLLRDIADDERYDRTGHLLTSGPGMHPRCAALAFQFCPHFKQGDDARVAAVHRGSGLGMLQDQGESIGIFGARIPGTKQSVADALQGGTPRLVRSCKIHTRAEIRTLAKKNPMGTKKRKTITIVEAQREEEEAA